MALATSSGVPRRRRGSCSTIFSVPGERIAVSISPGEMALTRTPSGPKSARHLAGQRGERRLRCGVGRAREGMHARARDRGDVDDRALGRRQFVDEAARQHDRGEEIRPGTRAANPRRRIERGEPRAAGALGRDARIVDERVQHAALDGEALLHVGDGAAGVVGIGEIDLEVILRPHLPRAILGKGVARAGDDPPSGGREALDGGVADARGWRR